MIDPELPEEQPVANVRMLRQFAGVWLVFFGALAFWQFSHDHQVKALVFGILALTVGPLGIVRPSAVRPVFATLSALTRPIGLVMTRVILAIMFYGVFTVVAVVFRLAGRDALGRRRHGASATYWQRRRLKTDAKRYLRQF